MFKKLSNEDVIIISMSHSIYGDMLDEYVTEYILDLQNYFNMTTTFWHYGERIGDNTFVGRSKKDSILKLNIEKLREYLKGYGYEDSIFDDIDQKISATEFSHIAEFLEDMDINPVTYVIRVLTDRHLKIKQS